MLKPQQFIVSNDDDLIEMIVMMIFFFLFFSNCHAHVGSQEKTAPSPSRPLEGNSPGDASLHLSLIICGLFHCECHFLCRLDRFSAD